jgi:hypothetical protein
MILLRALRKSNLEIRSHGAAVSPGFAADGRESADEPGCREMGVEP